MAIYASNFDLYTAPETVQQSLAVMAAARANQPLPGLEIVHEGVSTPCWEATPAKVGGNYARLPNGAYVHVVAGIYHSLLARIITYEQAMSIASDAKNGIKPMDVHHRCGVPWCVNPEHLALLPQAVHQRIPKARAGHGLTSARAGERQREAARQRERAVRAAHEHYKALQEVLFE